MNPMSCEKIESLLPAYMEEDLTADEKREVEAHLTGCAACRESLAGFTLLEEALLERREAVPPAGQVSKAVLAEIAGSRLKRVLDTIYSMPFLTSASFFIIGVILFIYRRHVQALFSRDIESSQELSRAGEWLTQSIVNLAGLDVWVLTAIYAGLILLILLGTGLMVFNFVRSE